MNDLHAPKIDSVAHASETPRGEAVDVVVQRLREGILAGQFAPGQRLINRELMEEVGVSRGTLREAFGRLAADGLVELVPNRGAVVRRMSREDLSDLFRIREGLEGTVCRIAAENIERPGNRALLASMWEAARPDGTHLNASIFAQKNRLFHRTILDLAGNRQLSELIEKMQLPMVMLQLGRALGPEDIELSIQEHFPIKDAIAAGDADAADLAMRRHLQGSLVRILHASPGVLKPDRR